MAAIAVPAPAAAQNDSYLIEVSGPEVMIPGEKAVLTVKVEGGPDGLLKYNASVPSGASVTPKSGTTSSRTFTLTVTAPATIGSTFAVNIGVSSQNGSVSANARYEIKVVEPVTLSADIVNTANVTAVGIPVQFYKAHVEGITKLGAADIKYAEQLGYRIKLLGITKRTAKGIELRVHPSLVPAKRLIANVEGAMNAVVVQGDAVGTTLYYGKGAGSEPTASAVIADLVDITRLHTADPLQRVPHLAFQPNELSNLPVLPMAEVVTSYYLRLRVADEAGVLAKVTGLLAGAGISIDAVLQREADEVGGEGCTQTDVIILTHDCVEAKMDAAIAQMQALPTVLATITRIRKEELA